ncbi:MAG: alpha/beta fold hydrolase [Pseudomonas piscis]|uniref:alpha/beta fold hydrolase n=1 Tax=Pseudomonas piscis TaxID=2614538 RepID=UPI003D288A58
MDSANRSQSLTAELEARLETDFALRRLPLPGGQQALRECGQGPVVVLLHGIGSTAASWLQVARQLASHARVIAWDAPGYGESSPLASPAPRAEDYAKRLGQMLDALQVERCLLVGHSLGALPALAYACTGGAHRIERLALISPARGYGEAQRMQVGREVRQQRLDQLQYLGLAAIAQQRGPNLVSPRATAEARAWAQWNMARLNPQGYRQAIELLCGDELLRHGTPAMPCTVHCGDVDQITPVASCQLIAQALGASFQVIADAGHASPIEQPHEVARRLAALLTPCLKGDCP